jgi:general secretion pathway protein H
MGSDTCILAFFPKTLKCKCLTPSKPILEREMKKNGFTLLELIIVLALLTLITGLTSVFVAGSLPSAKATAAGREIAGMIRHARSLARLSKETQTFVIDLDHRTYGIEGMAARSFPPEARVRVIDPVSGEIFGGKYPIVFSSAEGTSGGTIILSWRQKTIRIELDPIVGAVVLRDG